MLTELRYKRIKRQYDLDAMLRQNRVPITEENRRMMASEILDWLKDHRKIG